MFSQISWTQFFEGLAIVLGLYYTLTLILLNKSHFKSLITSKEIQLPLAGSNEFISIPDDGDNSILFPEHIHHLMDEVRAITQQLRYSKFSEENFKHSLTKLISADRFQAIKQTDYYPIIAELITTECKTNCSMYLNEEDLERLWMVSEND